MRCHRCKAPANVEIRRSRTAYCARCYPDWFRGQVQELSKSFVRFPGRPVV